MLSRALWKHFRSKGLQGEQEEGWERNSDSHTPICYNAPTEKGRKASLLLNCPFSRKCSGLKVSGVAHSAGSLCSAVRLVRTMVPWRRQQRNRQGLTHAVHLCRGAAVPRRPRQGLTTPWAPSPSPTNRFLSPSPQDLAFTGAAYNDGLALLAGNFTREVWLLLLAEWIFSTGTCRHQWENNTTAGQSVLYQSQPSCPAKWWLWQLTKVKDIDLFLPCALPSNVQCVPQEAYW